MIEPANHYIVLDYESQILPDGDKVCGPCVATQKKRHMSPYAGAHAPYLGYQEKGDDHITIIRHIGSTPGVRSLPSIHRNGGTGSNTILVGHNIGFDLHHLFAGVEVDDIPPFTIWDTQTAEYYFEAQRPTARWTKLKNAEGSLADRYGVEHGEDGLVKYFDAGIGADKIPPDEVPPYLCADVRVTHQVFILQFQRACEMGILEFLREMMDAQCAMFLMEKEGMPVRAEVADVIERNNEARAKELDEILHEAWEDYFPLMKPAEVDKHGKPKPGTRNPGSNQQLLQVLTSGTYKYQERVHQRDTDGELMYFKNGNPKMKLETKEARVQNGGGFDPEELTEVGEDTLSKMEGIELVDLIIERRKIKKTVDTYVNGYLRKAVEGRLRTSYNQSATPTGRPSSSNPNLQNLPKK